MRDRGYYKPIRPGCEDLEQVIRSLACNSWVCGRFLGCLVEGCKVPTGLDVLIAQDVGDGNG